MAPATLTVTTTSGGIDHTDAGLSLAEAVAAANGNSTAGFSAGEIAQINGALGADTIVFNLGAGGHTITLAGTLTLSDQTAATTVTGPGAAFLAVSGGHATGVFLVNGNVTATLAGLTITQGNSPNGGGIQTSGTLTVRDCTLSTNTATGAGGGIYNGGQLTVTNAALTGNAALAGGGLFNDHGTVTVTACVFSGNTSTGDAGGLENIQGAVTVTASTLNGNTADQRGGGVLSNGTLIISDSTLSGNAAGDVGGGIENGATLTVTNSTFAGNTAGAQGGGISNQYGGTLVVSTSTFSGNAAAGGGGIDTSGGTLTVTNTIVAGNLRGGTADDVAGTVDAASAFNLIGDATGSAGFSAANGNLLDVAPQLSALADHGGPTQTLALLAGSPARNAGSDALVAAGVTTDQRGVGFARFTGTVDIGAFEVQAANGPPTGVSAGGPYAAQEGAGVTLTAAAADPDGDPLTYSWDVNGDGTFGDATGASPTLTWAQLTALGITDGNSTSTFTVRVRVSDGINPVVVSPAGSLTVTNVAPTATAGGPYVVSEGGTVTLTGAATDPAGAADPLTYTWDLNGNGVFGETGAAATRGDEVGAHPVFRPAGLYGGDVVTVRLRADDGDGGVDARSATVAVGQNLPGSVVTLVRVGGTLYVTGDNNPNSIVLDAVGGGLRVRPGATGTRFSTGGSAPLAGPLTYGPGIQNLVIRLGAGNGDRVRFDAGSQSFALAGGATISGTSGDWGVIANASPATWVGFGGNLVVTGGLGTVTVDLTNVQVGGALTVNHGAGGDTRLTIGAVGARRSFLGSLALTAGTGYDRTALTATDVAGALTLALGNGAAGDPGSRTDLENVTVGGLWSLQAGAGADVVNVQTTAGQSRFGATLVALGTGADHLTLATGGLVRFLGSARLDGGAGGGDVLTRNLANLMAPAAPAFPGWEVVL